MKDFSYIICSDIWRANTNTSAFSDPSGKKSAQLGWTDWPPPGTQAMGYRKVYFSQSKLDSSKLGTAQPSRTVNLSAEKGALPQGYCWTCHIVYFLFMDANMNNTVFWYA